MRFLKYTLLVLLGLVLLAGAAGFVYWQSKKPMLDGEIRSKEVKENVSVLFDDYGVPHIYAQNEPDAFFALGYVHAQDRLFQMELMRRVASGRLAEILGSDLTAVDVFFRTIGMKEYAVKSVEQNKNFANEPYYKAAEAYVAGINQYIKEGATPIEFDLLGIPKEPFTMVDCQLIGAYMAFSFSEAFKQESILDFINQKYGSVYLKDLVPSWSNSAFRVPVDAKDKPRLLGMSGLINDIEQKLPLFPYHGSNAWVVAPQNTKAGKVLLSNDTHIGYGQPSVWYEAHLVCPNLDFYGSFLGGVPTAVLGHNPNFGWGITMFENDDVDFYSEQLNPQNPQQVATPTGWQTMQKRIETIHVKGKPDTTLEVLQTPHGAVVSNLPKLFKNTKPNEVVSVWWSYLLFPDQSIKAFYNLAHAKNIDEATPNLATIHAPGLNFMMGDKDGNIAWWAVAKLPKRPKGSNSMMLLDGASGKDDILGWYDFATNPHRINPPEGYLASSNSQPQDMGYGFIPGYYQPEDRIKRVNQLLSARKDWTAESLRSVINDEVSTTYPDLLKNILPQIIVDKNAGIEQTCYNLLQKWDGSHETTDVEPTIFYKLLYNIYHFGMQDELGSENLSSFLTIALSKRSLDGLIANNASTWWNDVSTPALAETESDILTKAFKQSVMDLEAQLGNNPQAWTWGKVHLLTHKHALSKQPPLDKLFNVGTFEVAGGRETVNKLDFQLDSTGIYNITNGPALRRIVDFGNPLNATSCLPTGQSGNLASPHYNDQATLYANKQARTEYMNREEIEKVSKNRLVFSNY